MKTEFSGKRINWMFAGHNPTALWDPRNNRRYRCVSDTGMTRHEVQHIPFRRFEHVSDTLCGVGQGEQVIKCSKRLDGQCAQSGVLCGSCIDKWRRLHKCSDASGDVCGRTEACDGNHQFLLWSMR
jgi:hypothetical protein